MMKSNTTQQFFFLSIFLVFLFLDGAPLAESFSAKTPAKLYVNVVVHDPSDAISNKLSEKIGSTFLPKFMKKRMSKRLGKVAGKIVKPTMVAEKMAAKMAVKVPQKMATKGVTAEMHEHYREGPYFVNILQVKHVDAAAMATAKTENKSIGARLQKFLAFIGAKNKDKIESYFLPGLIEKKLPEMMTEMMSEKMGLKGVKATAKVLPESKQSKYFDAKILEIRQAASKVVVDEESTGEEEL